MISAGDQTFRARAACLIALLAAGAALLAAPGDAAAAAHKSLSGAGSAAERRAVQRFWTAERIAAAERNVLNAAAPVRPIAGPPSPGTSPAARGPLTSVPARPPLATAAGRQSTLVPDPSVAPFATNGKIFGRSGGGLYVCSGTLINTPSQRVVVTAGHCLHEGPGNFGRWASKVLFIPGYDAGQRPYGTFVAADAYVLDGWFKSENINFDVGAIVLRPNAQGRPGDLVGTRGWITGASRKQTFQVFGYPASGASKGDDLRFCESGFRGFDPSTFRIPGPPTTKILCDFGGGASGGGWIINGDQLNGVYSYGYPVRRELNYGPYFGLAVKQLIGRLP